MTPEYDFHRTVMTYLNHALPNNVLPFHPANGGYRRASEAGRLKSMGVVPGLPDVGIVHQGKVIWLELKAKRGRLSPAQAYCHQRLEAAGSPVSVCKTLEDVEAALVRAGIPVKTRLA
jgi:hypothetical protein